MHYGIALPDPPFVACWECRGGSLRRERRKRDCARPTEEERRLREWAYNWGLIGDENSSWAVLGPIEVQARGSGCHFGMGRMVRLV